MYGVYVRPWRNAADKPRAEFERVRDAQLFAWAYRHAWGVESIEIFDDHGDQWAVPRRVELLGDDEQGEPYHGR